MADQKRTLIPGIKINMGGTEYVVPPLNFRQLEEHSEKLVQLSRMKVGETIYTDMTKIVPVVQAALSRNYPDITEEEVRNMLDMGNYRAVVDAVLAVSGLDRGKELLPGGESPVVGTQTRVQ